MVWPYQRPTDAQVHNEVRPCGLRIGVEPSQGRSWSEYKEGVDGALTFLRRCPPERTKRLSGLLLNFAIRLEPKKTSGSLIALAEASMNKPGSSP